MARGIIGRPPNTVAVSFLKAHPRHLAFKKGEVA